jgi:hypothetical protein
MLLNSKKFGLLIEDIVKKKKLSYIDATILYCEENNIDTGTISNLINKSLKEKIQIEAEEKKLLKISSNAKLPI